MKINIVFTIILLLLVGALAFTFVPSTQSVNKLNVPNLVAYHLTTDNIDELNEGNMIDLFVQEKEDNYKLVVSMWQEQDENMLTSENPEFRIDKVALTYPDTGEAYTFLVKTFKEK